jgi:HD domain
MQPIAAWAEGLARTLLADALPRRWSHVQGVAARARTLTPSLGTDADLIEAAAWLHDIGYLPELAETSLHGLDGARYLRDIQHAEPLLCRLVAHHSYAVIEAEERGLAQVMTREFAPPPQYLADALTFCDMTTSPDGEHRPHRPSPERRSTSTWCGSTLSPTPSGTRFRQRLQARAPPRAGTVLQRAPGRRPQLAPATGGHAPAIGSRHRPQGLPRRRPSLSAHAAVHNTKGK